MSPWNERSGRMCGGKSSFMRTLLVERPLAVKSCGQILRLARPVLAGMRVAPQCRQRLAIHRLGYGTRAPAVGIGIHTLHLLDAPAHQGRSSHQSERQDEYRRHMRLLLKPITSPQGTRFERRNYVFGKAGGHEGTAMDAGYAPAEQPACRGDDRA